MAAEEKTVHGQVIHQSQDVIGRLAQDLIKLPVVHGALSTIFDARERAARAQEFAMGALGIPSAADVERLTRRLRSVSQRIEGLEDGVDRVLERIDKRAAADLEARSSAPDLDERLNKLEAALQRIEDALGSR